jgi:threonine dehydrogenase-like Zn-dependent dehydrogenase
MAPIPKLVTDAVAQSAAGGIINIFAGIPAAVTGEINMDAYITKGLYLAATSGSTLDDIKTVLASVESGRLDTNTSVAAICGLESAIEAIRAVESRAIAGKIMVYPACKDLSLTRLEEMSQDMSQVADCLDNGLWTKEAEDMLLKIYSN